MWSDANYSSPAVQAALDHFWANSGAPDGVGLQDHYARVWQFVAQRFHDEPAVIGYDLMNEPFPGKDAARVLQASLQRLSEWLLPVWEHNLPNCLLWRQRRKGEGRLRSG